ncbi:MAG TPA: lanthionine synthetase C family protein [Steroidobacteraceae bacterium]
MMVIPNELRVPALEALLDITQTLPQPGSGTVGPTLAGGEAGFALFRAYLARSGLLSERESAGQEEMACAHLQSATDQLASIAQRPELFSGFAGVAWVAQHPVSQGFLDDSEDLCAAVDAALVAWLQDRGANMLCELISGLAGIGLYGLTRQSRAGGRKLVQHVVATLAQTAVSDQNCRTWFHSPEKLPLVARQIHPHGCYNLGLSHGIPGVLIFLGRAATCAAPGARELLSDATRWLLLQQRTYYNGSRFGHSFVHDPWEEPDGSRIAWCYGDLGIAASLLTAAQHTAVDECTSLALQLARIAAQRSVEEGRVMDAGLCHGAFGNSQVFARLHGATREPSLLEAAIRWLAVGLAMRKPGTGLAGFQAFRPPMPGDTSPGTWEATPSLLEGTCGIGLVLLGFLTPLEPAWDEFLMLNLPPMKV